MLSTSSTSQSSENTPKTACCRLLRQDARAQAQERERVDACVHTQARPTHPGPRAPHRRQVLMEWRRQQPPVVEAELHLLHVDDLLQPRKKHGTKADARDQRRAATQRSEETGSAAGWSLAVRCGQPRPPFWPACGFRAATYRVEGRRRRSPRPRAASRCQPTRPARASSGVRGTPKRPAQGPVSRACRA